MVYVIATTGALVLIDMLVTFIIFVVNPDSFREACLQDAYNNAQNALDTNLTSVVDASDDYYNCDRLFADQTKWSLLCVVFMYITYASIFTIVNVCVCILCLHLRDLGTLDVSVRCLCWNFHSILSVSASRGLAASGRCTAATATASSY